VISGQLKEAVDGIQLAVAKPISEVVNLLGCEERGLGHGLRAREGFWLQQLGAKLASRGETHVPARSSPKDEQSRNSYHNACQSSRKVRRRQRRNAIA
jgi:hypothetical protein